MIVGVLFIGSWFWRSDYWRSILTDYTAFAPLRLYRFTGISKIGQPCTPAPPHPTVLLFSETIR